MERPAPDTSPPRWDLLALLVAFAALLRAVSWWRTAAIFDDGPRFLALARAWAEGDWRGALADAYHPLYSLLVAGVQLAIPDWETAGAAVSIAAGSAAVVPLYLLLRDTFGAPYDAAGAAILAMHSRAVEHASDVQSDALYLLLFLTAAWLGWRALATRRAGWVAGCGAVAGLAYLTRPEGLGLVALAGGLAAAAVLSRRWSWRTGLRWGAALLAGLLLAGAPYVLYLQRATGVWTVTQKASMARFAAPFSEPPPEARAESAAAEAIAPAAVPPPPRQARGDLGRALAELWRTLRSAARVGLLVVLALGFAAARGRPGPRAAYLVGGFALYAGVLLLLAVEAGYVSKRHALPPLTLLLGYAGLGAAMVGRGVARVLRRSVPAPTAALIGVAWLSTLSLPEQLDRKRLDQLAERRAAEWLRDHAPAPAPVAGERYRVGYYAGMPYVPLQGRPVSEWSSIAARGGARYLVVDEAEAARTLEGAGLGLLHRVSAGGHEAWVFERNAPERNPGPDDTPAGDP